MKAGATLKSKTGLDKNVDEFFFVYDKPGGTKIGAVKESSIVGTYDRTESKLLTDYAYLKLATPITYNGKLFQYAYIREAAVYEFSPNLTTYYVKSTTSKVNIRSSATAASDKNIIGSLTANQRVGVTDGTTSNGFFLFTLPSGKTGWVSRNYITSVVPKGAVAPSTSEKPDTVTDPATDSPTKQLGTEIENSVGTTGLAVLKWAGIALLAITLGIVAARLYKNRNRKRP